MRRETEVRWELKHLSTSRKRKQLVIPLLAESEKGTGQTESNREIGFEMWWMLSLRYREKVVWNDPLQRVIAPYSKILWQALKE